MRVALLAVAAVAAEATQTVYTIPDKCAHAPCTRARATAARFVGKKVLSHFFTFHAQGCFRRVVRSLRPRAWCSLQLSCASPLFPGYYCWLVCAFPAGSRYRLRVPLTTLHTPFLVLLVQCTQPLWKCGPCPVCEPLCGCSKPQVIGGLGGGEGVRMQCRRGACANIMEYSPFLTA